MEQKPPSWKLRSTSRVRQNGKRHRGLTRRGGGRQFEPPSRAPSRVQTPPSFEHLRGRVGIGAPRCNTERWRRARGAGPPCSGAAPPAVAWCSSGRRASRARSAIPTASMWRAPCPTPRPGWRWRGGHAGMRWPSRRRRLRNANRRGDHAPSARRTCASLRSCLNDTPPRAAIAGGAMRAPPPPEHRARLCSACAATARRSARSCRLRTTEASHARLQHGARERPPLAT